jgi:hypothetical protein
MTDQKRLADALRARGFFYRLKDTGNWGAQPDEEVIAKTEGTMFRARVELGMAIDDLKAEFCEELGEPVMKILLALTRFIERFTRGKRK